MTAEPNDALPQEEYPVRLEAFEGPLDLLLYLIKKDEVDIYDIPIESITRQFNEYLGAMELLDLNVAGEFLVMSATLMHIKSRMLLPEEERGEELEDEEDPRWDLVRQLVEYKKFRDAALHLERLEDGQNNVLMPTAEGVELGQEPGLAIRDVSLFDLVRAVGEVLAKARRSAPHEVAGRMYTVAEKIDHIVRLTEELPEGKGVSLLALFEGMEQRGEIICTFLAVLELVRMHRIRAVQAGVFGDIEILRNMEEHPRLGEMAEGDSVANPPDLTVEWMEEETREEELEDEDDEWDEDDEDEESDDGDEEDDEEEFDDDDEDEDDDDEDEDDEWDEDDEDEESDDGDEEDDEEWDEEDDEEEFDDDDEDDTEEDDLNPSKEDK